MKRLSLISIVMMLAIAASAKSYKIGPSSVVGMDFTSINAAMLSVSAGDTLLLDKSYKETSEQTVTKAIVIIGNGFDTTTSTIAQVGTLNLKADGILVNSLYVTKVYFYNKDCRLYRCFVGSSAAWAESSPAPGSNSIHSCYFTGTINKGSSYTAIFDIQNTILYTSTYDVISNLENSNICHCVIYGNTSSGTSASYLISNVHSSTIIDNIIVNLYSTSYTISNYSVSNMNTIHHNVMSGFKNTTNYPLNYITNSTDLGAICKCSGTTVSGTYFELKSGSPALKYASDGSDCGIYGGLYPYVDYGRPIYVPYFTNINVPAKATNGTLPISVTVEVQNK